LAQVNNTEEGRELIGQFQSALTEFRNWSTKAQGEIQATGAVVTATKEGLLAAETKLTAVSTELGGLAERVAKVETDNRMLKQRGFRLGANGDGGDGGLDLRSFGQRVTQSNEFKAAQFTGRFRFSMGMNGRLYERKAASPDPLVTPTTITEAGSGWILYPQRVGVFVSPQMLPLVMRDLLTVIPLSGTNAVEYVYETWTWAADYQVNEGDKKAQGGVTYTDATAIVRTIAWFVKISRQMLSDVPYVAQTIDSRLIYGVLKKEEHEILWGDGATGHIKGIMPQATAAAVPPAGANRADELAMAAAALAAAGFAPSAIVLNPMDWAAMQIAKSGLGVYILGGPLAAEPSRLWGLQVVTTVEMPAGQYLVGAFPGNAALFDRETANAEISFENEDDFVRNLATIRAEERIALAVYLPQAFVKGTFVSASMAEATGGTQPAQPHASARK